MDKLPSSLASVYQHLLETSTSERTVSLNAIGDALGDRAVSVTEIESLFVALEGAGRQITHDSGIGAEAKLKRVVHAVRALRKSNRQPHLPTVAAQAGLDEADVLSALALLRVMQR